MGAIKEFGCEACESRKKGIFCDLAHSAIEDVGKNKVIINYKKGQTIFIQGNEPSGIYCINRGKIKVSKISDDGKESIVRIASSGDILGHRSLLSRESYGATATVIEDCTVCFLNKQYLEKTLQVEPSVAFRLIQKLSQAMGVAETKYAEITHKSVKVRLIDLLLNLKENYGTKVENGWRLDIKLTREEMGSMIGTTPETIIRILTELKDSNLIGQEGKTLYLNQWDRQILLRDTIK